MGLLLPEPLPRVSPVMGPELQDDALICDLALAPTFVNQGGPVMNSAKITWVPGQGWRATSAGTNQVFGFVSRAHTRAAITFRDAADPVTTGFLSFRGDAVNNWYFVLYATGSSAYILYWYVAGVATAKTTIATPWRPNGRVELIWDSVNVYLSLDNTIVGSMPISAAIDALAGKNVGSYEAAIMTRGAFGILEIQ